MKLIHCLQALYCEPAFIRPSMHKQVCDIVQAHVSGSANPQGVEAYERREKPRVELVDGNKAVIQVHGVMARRVSGIEKSSGARDMGDMEKDLLGVMNDDRIEGVLLHIDSPGGSAIGTPELATLVESLVMIKPVVAFADGMMASAAYYLAAPAEIIVGSSSAIVGSIGAYMALLDDSRAFELAGLKTEVFRSGRFKGLGLSGTELSDEAREHLQAQVDQLGDMFRAFVSDHREIAPEVMQGQDYIGEQALHRNLIDRLGTYSDALTELDGLMHPDA